MVSRAKAVHIALRHATLLHLPTTSDYDIGNKQNRSIVVNHHPHTHAQNETSFRRAQLTGAFAQNVVSLAAMQTPISPGLQLDGTSCE